MQLPLVCMRMHLDGREIVEHVRHVDQLDQLNWMFCRVVKWP